MASAIEGQLLNDGALAEAKVLKEAGRESRSHRALATVWELKKAEHYHKILQYLVRCDTTSLRLFEEIVGDFTSIEDHIRFQHALYSEEALELAATNAQMDVIEAEEQARVGAHGIAFDKTAVNV